MVSQGTRFSVTPKRILLRWFLLLLLVASLIGIPAIIAFREQPYPNLDILLIFAIAVSFMCLAVLADFGPLASVIDLHEDGFRVKRFCQGIRWHPYESIQTYSERPNSSKIESFQELTVYVPDNWFIIRSNEFKEYDDLKAVFTQYGQAGPRRKVFTLPERNQFRWGIIGLVLLISANIIFAYVAHNPTDKRPARLTTISSRVDQVLETKNKSRIKGFTLRLHHWPDFQFYVRRSDYNAAIPSLKQAILLNQPITLFIRESEYRKKLAKTEPLTFGDKYDNYQVVSVFGVDQNRLLHLRAVEPALEPTHTNPLVRTMLFGLLLVCCWVAWLYVDQHALLRAD